MNPVMIEYVPNVFVSNKDIDRIVRCDETFIDVYQRNNQKIISAIWDIVRDSEEVQKYLEEFWPEYMI